MFEHLTHTPCHCAALPKQLISPDVVGRVKFMIVSRPPDLLSQKATVASNLGTIINQYEGLEGENSKRG